MKHEDPAALCYEQIKKCHELLDGVNVPRAEGDCTLPCVSLASRLAAYIELNKTANFPENR